MRERLNAEISRVHEQLRIDINEVRNKLLIVEQPIRKNETYMEEHKKSLLEYAKIIELSKANI